MFKGFIFGIIFAVIVAAAAGYVALIEGVIPVQTAGGPVPFERFAARTSLRATLKRDAPKGPPPIQATDANLTQGVQLYGPRCAVCHGLANGHATSISLGEYPRPPMLAKHGVEDDPVGWTFWKIKNGIRWTGMPAWGHEMSDADIWKLALFLKRMDHLPPGAEAAWKALKGPGEAKPGAASAQPAGAPAAPQGPTAPASPPAQP